MIRKAIHVVFLSIVVATFFGVPSNVFSFESPHQYANDSYTSFVSRPATDYVTDISSASAIPRRVSTPKELREQHCFALNLYHESRGEGYEGKLAVGMVVINRLNSPKYPKTVCGVIYQRLGKKYQFSWVGQLSKESLSKKKNFAEWNESKRIAILMLTENKRYDKVSDSLYYHADYVNPNWPYQKVTQIGRHIFYRQPGV